ncbi:oxidative stress survival, Svf1-like protein [Lipomyces oligophaga]|uniref:oxidative stress survival, Svf1-like protein n=1 Tax=Lipomyces oligophaga TaxID=45792 RepID=UPI0034CFD513
MLKWVQSGLSAVAGTAEPVYGPEAFHAITEAIPEGTNPYSELVREDLAWRDLSFTNVETQTFYFTLKTGHVCFAQVILSNLAGIHTTSQFTCRIYHPDKPEESVWTSTNLNDYHFNEDRTHFMADNVSIELNDDMTAYSIKSTVNKDSIVEVIIVREAPSFKIGKDGITKYGTDPEKPWGSMRHVFWPRSNVSGKITVKGVDIAVDGKAMFVMALQGMKPQHAAARWNFANFQGPTTSAVMMEFTTTPAYGSQVVNIGVVVRDDKILAGTIKDKAEHTTTKQDTENDWPEPTTIKFSWSGVSPEDNVTPVEAVIDAKIDNLVERVDVMAEIPQFVKKIVAGVAGTKPYIYQYCNPATIKVKVGDKEYEEVGNLYNEATFIS